MTRFTVVLTSDPASGGYTVMVPALPGCVTDGATVDDALLRAQDAIMLYLRDEPDSVSVFQDSFIQVVVAEVMVA